MQPDSIMLLFGGVQIYSLSYYDFSYFAWILATFAINYNKLFGLIGHVWYDRFHSTIIYNFMQYVRTFLYIGENPVKAKIVNYAC